MGESSERARTAEASRWFTRVTDREISAEDLYAFQAWRREPANAAAFEAVKTTWEKAGGLGDRPAIAAATAAALAAHPPKPAGAGLGGVGAWGRRAPLAWAAAGLLVVAGGLGLFAVRALGPQTYSTDVGGQRVEVLADGSRLRLNTDSKAVVAFGGGRREVRLVRGEAFFEVAHDAARPFVVEADGARVRALGTRFDVRRDGPVVRVTLVEGRLQVRHAAQADGAVLVANQSVTVDAGGVSQPKPADAAAVTGWTTGRLTFRGATLASAIAEVNRYSTRKVVLDAPASVGAARVSGQFVAGDTEAFVAGVTAVYGLKATARGDREIRLAPGG